MFEADALKCYNCMDICGDLRRELIECEPEHNLCSYSEGVIVTIAPPVYELTTRFDVQSNPCTTVSAPPSNHNSWTDVIERRIKFYDPLELYTGKIGYCTGNGCVSASSRLGTHCYSMECYGLGCQLYSGTSVEKCDSDQNICYSRRTKRKSSVLTGSYDGGGEMTSAMIYKTSFGCESLEMLKIYTRNFSATENSCLTRANSEGSSTTVHCSCLASTEPCVPFGMKLVDGINSRIGDLRI